MEPFLYNNDREMHSTHNEKKLLLLKHSLEPYNLKFINA